MRGDMVKKLAEVSRTADEYIREEGQFGRIQTEKSKVMDQILKLMEIDAQVQLANRLRHMEKNQRDDSHLNDELISK